MKITQILTVNGQTVHMADLKIVQELNRPGRALFTLKSDEVPTGIVRYFSGLDGSAELVFSGAVASVQNTAFNTWRILVRELSCALAAHYPLSFRMQTAKTILSEISKRSGVGISATGPWLETVIPHFCAVGCGFSSISAVGDFLKLKNQVILPQPDGSVFFGDYDESSYSKTRLQIPAEWLSNLNFSGGQIPAVPRVRPGLKIKTGSTPETFIVKTEISAQTLAMTFNANPWRNSCA